jgi:ERCC4-related helicase
MASKDVLVMMAKKFYDLLVHGFIQMSQIALLVIDECHHTDQEHLYNMIMRDFFFHEFNPRDPNCRRPRVLGLTASPIKQKIDSKSVHAPDIEKMLQNLANNLYSRYVTMSPDEIQQMEQQLETEIVKYSSSFDENVETVQQIEEILLKDLVASLKLPSEFYKTELNRYKQPIKQIVQQLNNSMTAISREE